MKPPKIPSIISLIILTTITLIFWVLFEVLRAFIAKPSTSVPQEITQSLSPSLDTNTVNEMQSAVFFDKSQIPQSFASPTPIATHLPTPSPIGTPISSPSASPIQTISP